MPVLVTRLFSSAATGRRSWIACRSGFHEYMQEDEIRRRQESVDLRCPWCERQRTYIGVLGFITGHTGFLTDHPSELGQQVLEQHAYRCDQCGSMMFFADGFLPHPLPGRPAAAG
ncbi:hypothetical protein [Nocardia asiatica]|uniref:hypothetical protein n=1 Tax=Nocardia asiatica TaxID=209252 RepID=UPI0012F8749C|nr:hypothetical protein [Nocardia asiatica]